MQQTLSNRMLVACHPRPWEDHIPHWFKDPTEAIAQEHNITEIVTADIQGNPTLKVDLFSEAWLKTQYQKWKVVCLPDCGGPWFESQNRKDLTGFLRLIESFLSLVCPGGELVFSKILVKEWIPVFVEKWPYIREEKGPYNTMIYRLKKSGASQFPINPEVLECYRKYKINPETVPNIVRKNDEEFQVQKTCVYHTPRNYVPKNYIFALDLDNTLTYHEKTLYVKHADDIHLLPKRYEILQKLFKLGYTLVVFTNQSGMKVKTVIERMRNFLRQVNLPIYVFASLKSDNFRKPATGMWSLFLEKTKIVPEKIYFSGDALGRHFDFADSDNEFGKAIKASIITPEQLFGEFDAKSIIRKSGTPNASASDRGKEVVLFVGPPGANKTTLYQSYYSDYTHISKDFHKSKELALYNSALQRGENIVVDDTNPTIAGRKAFIDPARKLGYNITILYFVKAGHNYNDKREKKVPAVVYHIFFKKLEVPTKEEGEIYLVY